MAQGAFRKAMCNLQLVIDDNPRRICAGDKTMHSPPLLRANTIFLCASIVLSIFLVMDTNGDIDIVNRRFLFSFVLLLTLLSGAF